MLHGFCVDHRLLLPLEPALEQHGGWRRVYVDLPGMGKSPAGPEIDSADAVAKAVVDFARDTFVGEHFAVLGNSFGGMLARHLVSRLRDHVLGLALLSPVVVADRSLRDLPERTVVREDPELIASLDSADAREYTAIAVVQSPENWESFRDYVLPGTRCFRADVAERIEARYALSVEPEAQSAAYVGPTLMVTGRQDHITGYRDPFSIVDHYPNATVAVLDCAGHNVHLDQPTLTAALVDDWLTRIEQSRQLRDGPLGRA